MSQTLDFKLFNGGEQGGVGTGNSKLDIVTAVGNTDLDTTSYTPFGENVKCRIPVGAIHKDGWQGWKPASLCVMKSDTGDVLRVVYDVNGSETVEDFDLGDQSAASSIAVFDYGFNGVENIRELQDATSAKKLILLRDNRQDGYHYYYFRSYGRGTWNFFTDGHKVTAQMRYSGDGEPYLVWDMVESNYATETFVTDKIDALKDRIPDIEVVGANPSNQFSVLWYGDNAGRLVPENLFINDNNNKVLAIKNNGGMFYLTAVTNEGGGGVTPGDLDDLRESLQTRIVETIPAGVLTSSHALLVAPETGTLIGTLLRPMMNFTIAATTEVSVWLSQVGAVGATAQVAIFRLDLQSEKLVLIGSSPTFALEVTGRITVALTNVHPTESERVLHSDGWYYATVVTADSNARFLGLEDYRLNQPAVNVWPRLVWKMDNASSDWDPFDDDKRDIPIGNATTDGTTLVKPYICLRNP